MQNIEKEAIKAHLIDMQITWLSNYRYPKKGIAGIAKKVLQKVQIGNLYLDTHLICTSIKGTWMASFAMFPTVFKTYAKPYRRFRSKKGLKKHF